MSDLKKLSEIIPSGQDYQVIIDGIQSGEDKCITDCQSANFLAGHLFTAIKDMQFLQSQIEYFSTLAKEKLKYIAKNEEELSRLRGEVERYKTSFKVIEAAWYRRIPYKDESGIVKLYLNDAAIIIGELAKLEQLKDSGDD